MLVIGKERGGGGRGRSLAWLGRGWIALPDEKFESLGRRGDIYTPVPVIGGGERWWCRWPGQAGLHSGTEGSSLER